MPPHTQPSKLDALRWKLGHLAHSLRERQVYILVILLATLVNVVATFIFSNTREPTPPWVLVVQVSLAVAAALAVAGDKIADRYVKKAEVADRNTRLEETNRALVAVSGYLDSVSTQLRVNDGTMLQRIRRSVQTMTHMTASGSLASEPRVTFYELTRDPSDWRQMKDPISSAGASRRLDKAGTEFYEQEDPTNSVWAVLSLPDDQVKPASKSDDPEAIDWKSKPYQSFLSVPVKAAGVVFGMLSINTPEDKGISETDRLLLIAMARLIADLYAMASPNPSLAAEREKQRPVRATGYTVPTEKDGE